MRKVNETLSGRRREAARNDIEILAAARAVFLADPYAPISTVAARANVGIGALYLRYASKEELLRELARDALERFTAELERSLSDEREPWAAYCDCLARVLDDGSQALAQRLAGTFDPTPELNELSQQAASLAKKVHRKAQRAKALRSDVSTGDVTLLLEALGAITLPRADGEKALRRRYLTLLLQALREPAIEPLPGQPPDPAELARRWNERRMSR